MEPQLIGGVLESWHTRLFSSFIDVWEMKFWMNWWVVNLFLDKSFLFLWFFLCYDFLDDVWQNSFLWQESETYVLQDHQHSPTIPPSLLRRILWRHHEAVEPSPLWTIGQWRWWFGFKFIKFAFHFSFFIFFKGANEIMTSPFFGTIDFDALLRHEIVPPFKPDVQNEQDTKWEMKRQRQKEKIDSFSSFVFQVCPQGLSQCRS